MEALKKRQAALVAQRDAAERGAPPPPETDEILAETEAALMAHQAERWARDGAGSPGGEVEDEGQLQEVAVVDDDDHDDDAGGDGDIEREMQLSFRAAERAREEKDA